MHFLEGIDTAALHHAYVVQNTQDELSALREFFAKNYKTAELYVREIDSFGIGESRELIHLAGMRSLGTQVFLYRTQTMTREAQNALLKLFEEPPMNTHFFLCVGSVSELLPTLCSRVHVLEGETATVAPLEFHTQFLGATVAARIALLEPILKEKDTAAAASLLRGLEKALALQSRTNENRKVVQHIIAVRDALAGKGPSLKALLESVALATPVVS